MNGINFDPQGTLKTSPAYMHQGGGGGFADPMTLALLGASAGFLDPHGGMMGGFQGALQGMQAGNQLKNQAAQSQMTARKLQKQIQTEEYMKNLAQKHAGNPMAMAREAITSGDPTTMQMGINIAKGLGTKYLQSQDASGNAVHAIGNNFGDITNTDARVPTKLMQVNEGNQISGRNPYTFEPVGNAAPVNMSQAQQAQLGQSANQFNMTHALAQQNSAINQYKTMMELDPGFLAQKAKAISGARETGKIQAETAANLPETLGVLAESLNLSDDLKNHPALDSMVGSLPQRAFGKGFAMYGGNKQADFQAKLEQSQGKQFLSAIQYMRGFGSLTVVEGDKMQSSAAAMSTAQSPADFKRAQDDYQAALISGVRKIAPKIGMSENEVINLLNKERSTLRGDAAPRPQVNSEEVGRGNYPGFSSRELP